MQGALLKPVYLIFDLNYCIIMSVVIDYSTDREVCKDNTIDCPDHFEADPSICSYPMFASMRCAKTCGNCTDNNPSNPNTGRIFNPLVKQVNW